MPSLWKGRGLEASPHFSTSADVRDALQHGASLALGQRGQALAAGEQVSHVGVVDRQDVPQLVLHTRDSAVRVVPVADQHAVLADPRRRLMSQRNRVVGQD